MYCGMFSIDITSRPGALQWFSCALSPRLGYTGKTHTNWAFAQSSSGYIHIKQWNGLFNESVAGVMVLSATWIYRPNSECFNLEWYISNGAVMGTRQPYLMLQCMCVCVSSSGWGPFIDTLSFHSNVLFMNSILAFTIQVAHWIDVDNSTYP